MLKRLCTFSLLIVLCQVSSVVLAEPVQKVLLLGDSLGASYGVAADQGWAYLLNARLQKEKRAVQIVNASISGDTTAGGLARLKQALQQEQPQWVLIELGGNDGLRGLDLNAMKKNLAAMIDLTHQFNAQAALVGILLPPNYGRKYRQRFEQVFVDVSTQKKVPLLPFLLEGVGGIDKLMQEDRIHPNATAQPAIAENVGRFLQPLLDGYVAPAQQGQ